MYATYYMINIFLQERHGYKIIVFTRKANKFLKRVLGYIRVKRGNKNKLNETKVRNKNDPN